MCQFLPYNCMNTSTDFKKLFDRLDIIAKFEKGWILNGIGHIYYVVYTILYIHGKFFMLFMNFKK